MSYQVNFCETKEQLKHLAEVVTGKADGSPTGADIDTSTLSYAGLVRDTLPELLSKLGWYSVGEWSSNPLISSVNEYVLYNGIRYVPLSIPYQVDSTANPDPEVLVGTELKVITDVTDEDITEAQNEIVGGSIFKGSNGETVENGDVVEPGITHLRVLVGGEETLVSIRPLATGVVSSLTSGGAIIGGTPVLFTPANFAVISDDDSKFEVSGIQARVLSHHFNVFRYMTDAQIEDCLLDTPVIDHSSAFQSAVNDSISTGVKSIFIPFTLRQRYKIDNQVLIQSSGFAIYGDASPRYMYKPNPPASPDGNGGYITGNAVNVINQGYFNYGNDETVHASNQFYIDGVQFLGDQSFTTIKPGSAVIISQRNNGPHRGIKCLNSGQHGLNGLVEVYISDTTTTVAAGTVELGGVVVRGGTYCLDSLSRIVGGLHIHDSQIENGASIRAFVDGQASINDNMLEGNTDTIDITGFSPQVDVRGNYFELNEGETVGKFTSQNPRAYLDVGKNYLQNLQTVDIWQINGLWSVDTTGAPCPVDRKSLLSTGPGKVYIGSQSSILNSIVYKHPDGEINAILGMSSVSGHNPKQFTANADSTKALDTVALYTPFGETTTGKVTTGFPASYETLSLNYGISDTIVVAALVYLVDGERPAFYCYNEAFASIGVDSSQWSTNNLNRDEGWYVMFAVATPSVAGTELKLRFGSNDTSNTSSTEIKIAAIGAYVIPTSEVDTFGPSGSEQDRQRVRFFNPWFM